MNPSMETIVCSYRNLDEDMHIQVMTPPDFVQGLIDGYTVNFLFLG